MAWTEMEVIYTLLGVCVSVGLLAYAWGVLDLVWFKPKKLEKWLKQQGLKGNPYRILSGDTKEFAKMTSDAISKPMALSDNVAPRVNPYFVHLAGKYGKNCYAWMGPIPMVFLRDPELIKEVLNKSDLFQKPKNSPLGRKLVRGLVSYEKEQWAKHRRLINPAFYSEKLKLMQPAFLLSCSEMLSKWEGIVYGKGTSSCEVDVWPDLQGLTCDVISRTAFGSSYEEGKRIFELLKEQAMHFMEAVSQVYIPGWRFVPTKRNRRMSGIENEVTSTIQVIIDKRINATQAGEANTRHDLLGILLESNFQEIRQQGNKECGMSIEQIMDECVLFYFAGQETTSAMLVWTMILLSRFQDWQARAREEVLQVFGDKKPDFEGLNNLKVVTMILYESLRLYPPVSGLARKTIEETKLGEIVLPQGTMLMLPTLLMHVDTEIWGDDAKEFKPERFQEGIMKATNGKQVFFPFGGGPRICVAQNFALVEGKMALAMILQRFSFELSPSYAHAPYSRVTTQPQYGAPLIMHKL
ncbi:PREDICTED: cytochrome P450 CYP72A219-like [Ipomoea nil]|uniref:cytochrome P450 CYP72A219-like n=1 Tax=Ipomoea nil TaxID=35883 RepID=UPI000901E077|nr:PREDICTED: cytochrome P450 CYP72A219-like [Ipomoea nil]